MKESYKIDIAVLLVFFARPEHFSKVFAAVKKARPSRLYLYQDGPRQDRNDDIENIMECRKIVEHIDWQCEIYTWYQEKNIGCDPSMFNSINWMFKTEKMGIILEDDVVPSQSFFPFCKELLEKYEKDKRIYCISGMNHLGEYKSEYADYIFTRNQSIWGWATWQRCIKEWDANMPFLRSFYALDILKKTYAGMNATIYTCTWHYNSGKKYFESIGWAYQNSNHMLNIVPTKNMISNVGIGDNGTHGANSMLELPKVTRRMFRQKVYELEFPICHPQFIIDDINYLKKVNYINGVGHPVLSFFRAMDAACRRFFYADKKSKKEKICRLPETITKIMVGK